MEKSMRRRVRGGFQNFFLLLLSVSAFLSALSCPAMAELRLPALISDNMVLMRNRGNTLWGWAEPGETVSAALDSLHVETECGPDGRWSLVLPAMEAGGPYTMTIAATDSIATASADSVTVGNILFGEVWLCSGQSNMQWRMGQLKDIELDLESADIPEIRMLTVPRQTAVTPQDSIPGESKPGWVISNPDTVKMFSAVAYYFGRELHERLRVPVGLISSSWGGSVAEAWTRVETLRSYHDLAPIVSNLDSLASEFPEHKRLYDERVAARKKAIQDSIPNPPPAPRGLRDPGTRDYPGGLYNAMINPLIPYGIAGAIWYQGESNSDRAIQYRTLFPAMIRDWREVWGQGDFPFLFVQLANWDTVIHPVEGGWGSWPELREAQLMTLKLPNTGMAVTVDIGDSSNIHPNNKWDVGRRLAINALAIAYGRTVTHSGPIFSAYYRNGSSVRLRFRHVAEGLVSGDLDGLKGFTIAGRDRVFLPAEAHIEGSEVVVSHPDISDPVAVRYGWEDNPSCNLYNSAGLPASPFRTDEWPGVTEGKLVP